MRRSARPRRPRLFQAYGVGLPKSGTTSLAEIFRHYRSRREFLVPEAVKTIGDFKKGGITEDGIRDFILRRDAAGWLEMDSNGINHWYRRVLIREFPDAKFIFTIRDCYSWCDSMIRHLLRLRPTDHAHVRWARFEGLYAKGLFQDETVLRRHADRILGRLLAYWAQNEDILRQCPSARTLVVKTSDISCSLPRIADFVGVPPETLDSGRVRSNVDAGRGILQLFDRGELEKKFKSYASSFLMKTYFPEVNLSDFLRNDGRNRFRLPFAARRADFIDPEGRSRADPYPINYWINQAEAAMSRGRRELARRSLARAGELMPEADERRRIAACRRRLERRDRARIVSARPPGAGIPGRAGGRRPARRPRRMELSADPLRYVLFAQESGGLYAAGNGEWCVAWTHVPDDAPRTRSLIVAVEEAVRAQPKGATIRQVSNALAAAAGAFARRTGLAGLSREAR